MCLCWASSLVYFKRIWARCLADILAFLLFFVVVWTMRQILDTWKWCWSTHQVLLVHAPAVRGTEQMLSFSQQNWRSLDAEQCEQRGNQRTLSQETRSGNLFYSEDWSGCEDRLKNIKTQLINIHHHINIHYEH